MRTLAQTYGEFSSDLLADLRSTESVPDKDSAIRGNGLTTAAPPTHITFTLLTVPQLVQSRMSRPLNILLCSAL